MSSRHDASARGGGAQQQREVGWAALQNGQWRAAREAFEAALSDDESAEALEGLSWAAWWLDDADALFDARERAFRAYREAGQPASAARMATWLAADHLDFRGALAPASGWLDRAQRLLEPLPTCADHGWLAFHRSFVAMIKGDSAAAEQHAREAAELGRALGVPDLEMLGLAVCGATLVSRAQVEQGMRSLDEASAIALSGEVAIPISRAWTCCFLVTACTRVLDFQRAFEWCDRIAEFAERYGSRYMLGFCRAEYATIYLWRGQWQQAEGALAEAIEALEASRAPMVSGPRVQLAELRRRQGDVTSAEALLEQAGGGDAAQLCRARLALGRGDAQHALDLAARVLRGIGPQRPVHRLPALELVARAELASGALEAAAASIDELARVAQQASTVALCARAQWLRGALALARGDYAEAKPLIEDAVDAFERCGARYDAACARVELARVLVALGRSEDAFREAEAACQCFVALGAVPDAECARRVLGGGPSTRATTASTPMISSREMEVLRLLAEGLTNREIAGHLYISEHTVHRHVASILRKLRVPSRAAAVAQGARAGWIATPRR